MRIIPKGTTEEAWQPLVQHRDYAVLCGETDSVFFRFGAGKGMYISVDPSPPDFVLNSIDFESGDLNLIAKLPRNTPTTLGRTSECTIKVMHPIISRQHLKLTLQQNVLTVRDLGSTNGTYILKELYAFDIAKYLEAHPITGAHESTMDWVHEAFGPYIDDFLKQYSQSQKETN